MNPFVKANRILAGVGVLFLGCLAFKLAYPQSLAARCLLFAAEAALVGGIADWFAVEALFRRPLGLSWHTGLVPRNRRRLIDGTAKMVQDKFFSQSQLQNALESWPIAETFITWVEEGKGRYILLLLARQLLRDWLDKLEPEALAGKLEGWVRGQLNQLAAAPAVASWGRQALAEKREAPLWEALAKALLKQVRRPESQEVLEGWLRAAYEAELAKRNPLMQLLGGMMEAAGQIDTKDLAKAALEETEKFLEALRTEEQHPLRLWLRDKAEELLLELEASPDQAQRMEAWKEELFQAVPVQEVLLQLLRLLRSPVGPKAELEALLGEPGRDISLRTPLVSWVLTQLMGYWDYFKKNQSLRLLLEGSCKEALSHLLAGHRHLIGEVAVHALDRLSAERLNRLVEEKVGEDLAWIRINGSLVGGIIGFCLFWMLEALR